MQKMKAIQAVDPDGAEPSAANLIDLARILKGARGSAGT
jgi:hypothetical protein